MKEEDTLIKRARKRFQYISKCEAQLRKAGLEDLRYRAGQQWPDNLRSARESPNEERPTMTINKSRRFINLIINDGRQQRPSIRVRSAGGQATQQTAQLLENFVRSIQMDSRADLAYDCALESAATIGWGFWRIITEYDTPTSFDQVIRIERILDTFSVYLDPDAEADGTGAKYAFITTMIHKKELEDEYPDIDMTSWEGSGVGDQQKKGWADGDFIRVAEYFEVEVEKKTLYLLPGNQATLEKPESDDLILATRETEIPVVKWYKLTGVVDEPLEESEWPGSEIPIVRTVGDEYRIDGNSMYEGVIRHAKDPMRIYNYWASSLTEQVAMAPKAPYIAAAGQIERYADKWRQANIRPQAVLPYDPVSVSGTAVPPPIKVPAPEVSTGILSALQIADADIQATVGFYQANLGEPSNERSGVAISQRQRQGELGMSHYLDNWSRSLVRTGRLLLDLIPKVYDTPRMLRSVGEDDRVNLFMSDPNQDVSMIKRMVNGQQVPQVNMALGRYDVAVSVGPSYQTRRQEAATSMIEFIKVIPNLAQVTADLIVKNMDWPGAEELRDRIEKTLPPDIVGSQSQGDTPEVRSAKNAIMAKAKQLQQQAQQLQQAQQQLQITNQQREKDLAQMEFKAFKDKAQAELKELKARFTQQITQLRQQLVREREKAIGHREKKAAQDVEVMQ